MQHYSCGVIHKDSFFITVNEKRLTFQQLIRVAQSFQASLIPRESKLCQNMYLFTHLKTAWGQLWCSLHELVQYNEKGTFLRIELNCPYLTRIGSTWAFFWYSAPKCPFSLILTHIHVHTYVMPKSWICLL